MSEIQQLLVILFADITGSTTLYEKIGDVRAQELVSNSLRTLIAETERAGGSLVQTVGDEVMATFPTADAAFRAAVAMQEAHNDAPVSIRIGFHYGPVIRKGDNLFGNAVNVAARMATWATAREIVTTEESVRQLSAELRERVRHLDTTTVKGKDEPVSIYEVIWRSEDLAGDNLTVMFGAPPTAGGGRRLALVLNYRDRECRLRDDGGTFTIGREGDNDLVVGETFASRHHAKIVFTRGKFMLTDQSSNGTYVSEENAQVVVLRRETMNLLGRGRIGLGADPRSDAEGVINFRCLDAD